MWNVVRNERFEQWLENGTLRDRNFLFELLKELFFWSSSNFKIKFYLEMNQKFLIRVGNKYYITPIEDVNFTIFAISKEPCSNMWGVHKNQNDNFLQKKSSKKDFINFYHSQIQLNLPHIFRTLPPIQYEMITISFS